MSERFYNPGSKICEQLPFDHPTNDPRSFNLISYFKLDAPEKSYFEVPTEIEVETVNGPQSVAVKFADRIRRDYKDYGIVHINPKIKDPNPADNVAPNEKDAKEKGTRLYREFLEVKAREHINNVDIAKQVGSLPRRATGVYAHALKVLGIVDPADQVGTVVESNRNIEGMSELQAKYDRLAALVESLTAPAKPTVPAKPTPPDPKG